MSNTKIVRERIWSRLKEVALPDSRFRRVFSESMLPGATETQKRWIDELQPLVTSKDTAISAAQERQKADVMDLLPDVAAPTLVLHARGN